MYSQRSHVSVVLDLHHHYLCQRQQKPPSSSPHDHDGQVLTGEDWNQVMYTSINAKGGRWKYSDHFNDDQCVLFLCLFVYLTYDDDNGDVSDALKVMTSLFVNTDVISDDDGGYAGITGG